MESMASAATKMANQLFSSKLLCQLDLKHFYISVILFIDSTRLQ
jgi:hypothetical protein